MLTLNSIIGLIDEGVVVIDNSIVKVDYPDTFTHWDYTYI